jgi:hypothetical protein
MPHEGIAQARHAMPAVVDALPIRAAKAAIIHEAAEVGAIGDGAAAHGFGQGGGVVGGRSALLGIGAAPFMMSPTRWA